MTEIKDCYSLDMSDIVNQLRVKAGVMEMGLGIALSSDIELMRKAADEIDVLKKKISTYENALKEISELSYVKQDECCCIALGALDTYS